MDTNDITVQLTEVEHEVMIELLIHALECYHLVSPYDSGFHDLPLDNPIIQRYDTIENLRARFVELWQDRWEQNEIY
jgi:hypothetical protein